MIIEEKKSPIAVCIGNAITWIEFIMSNRRYNMAEILSIRRKTLFSQSIILTKAMLSAPFSADSFKISSL